MLRLTKNAWVMFLIVLVATGAALRSSVAQKASVPKPQDKLALGEVQVKQILLLMETDNHGKVSKHDYMTFMEAEFDRLDKSKNGHLDVKELKQSDSMTRQPAHANAGK